MTTKCTKWPQNIHFDRKVDKMAINRYLPLEDFLKFTQAGIFGLKIYHLATLLRRQKAESFGFRSEINAPENAASHMEINWSSYKFY
jgi:hypothetical protein